MSNLLPNTDETEARTGALGETLKAAGLRLTEQRLAIAKALYAQGARHLTAELLHAELEEQGQKLALATVYNTLHQLTHAGLLKQIIIDPGRIYFDTNISQHHHFFHEETGQLEDIPSERVRVTLDAADPRLAACPHGTQIASVDVVIRLAPLR